MKPKYIIIIATTLLAGLFGMFQGTFSKSSEGTEQNSNNYKKIKIKGIGDNNKIDMGTHTQDDHSTTIKVTKTEVDNSVKSYGQRGGITAQSVIISDEELAKQTKNNYTITEYKLGSTWPLGKKAFLIKPIYGSWGQPFVAVKKAEDSLGTSQSAINSLGFYQNLEREYKGVEVTVYSMKTEITKSTGILLTYWKKPTQIVFGDWLDSNKQYVKTLD